MSWANSGTAGISSTTTRAIDHFPYAIHLVVQVNYGSLESKRYFIPGNTPRGGFVETTEEDMLNANFEKINS
jgi:hypothetical protein